MAKNKQTKKNLPEVVHPFIRLKQIESDLANGKFDDIEYFLENASRQALEYAFEWASYHGNFDWVKEMLRLGVNIHVNNDVALQMSVQNNHIDVVKYLIINGADINAANSSPLTTACENENIEIVKILLSAKSVGPDEKLLCDVHGSYDAALRMAVTKGNLEIVKLLIEHGADIHVFDDWPLMTATKNNHVEIIKLLSQ